MDCVFCNIVTGKIPTEVLYQDEELIAFPDIRPLTPIHLLIVPRKHIPSLVHLPETEAPLIGRMAMVARQLAKEKGIADRGYRLMINTGAEGGQVVPHLHMHLLGGRQLK